LEVHLVDLLIDAYHCCFMIFCIICAKNPFLHPLLILYGQFRINYPIIHSYLSCLLFLLYLLDKPAFPVYATMYAIVVFFVTFIMRFRIEWETQSGQAKEKRLLISTSCYYYIYCLMYFLVLFYFDIFIYSIFLLIINCWTYNCSHDNALF